MGPFDEMHCSDEPRLILFLNITGVKILKWSQVKCWQQNGTSTASYSLSCTLCINAHDKENCCKTSTLYVFYFSRKLNISKTQWKLILEKLTRLGF